MARHQSPLTQRLGLVFSVRKAQRTIKEAVPQTVSKTAGIYAAATVEFLVAEALNSIVDQMNELGNHRITPRHVKLAFLRDQDFHELLGDIMVPHGGTLPNIHVELLFSRHRLRMGRSTRRKLEREESDEEKRRKEDASEDSDTSVFSGLSNLPSGPPSTSGKRGSNRNTYQQKEKANRETTACQTTVDTVSESEDTDALPSFPDSSSRPSAKPTKFRNKNSQNEPIVVLSSDLDSDKENPPRGPESGSRGLAKSRKIGPPGRAIKGRRRKIPSPERAPKSKTTSGSKSPERIARKKPVASGKGKSTETITRLVQASAQLSTESSNESEDGLEDFPMDMEMDANVNQIKRSYVVPPQSDEDDDSDLDQLSSSPPLSRYTGKGSAPLKSSPASRAVSRKAASSHASSLPDASPPSSDRESSTSERMQKLVPTPRRALNKGKGVSRSRSVSQEALTSDDQRGAQRPAVFPNFTSVVDSQTQDSLPQPLSTQDVDRLKTPSLNYSASPTSNAPAADSITSRNTALSRPAVAQYPPGFARKTLPVQVAPAARKVVDASNNKKNKAPPPGTRIIEIGSSDDDEDDDELVLLPGKPVKRETMSNEGSPAAPKTRLK